MKTASATPVLIVAGESIALNAAAIADAIGEGIALNLAGEEPPEWVQVLPRGPKLQGHDGRAWVVSNVDALVEAFNADGIDLPVDINHATQLKASRGEEAPAAGWIVALEARNGELFGKVSWTERGRAAVVARDYRYVSPVFRFDGAGRVTKMRALGLVNSPNFIDLPALNAEQQREVIMKDILTKLGLAETATAADAIVAIDKLLTAANSAKPSLDEFVPRADHALALNRAQEAEGKLAAYEKKAHEDKVTAAIDGALKAGKIAPASKDYHLAMCASAEGLAAFEKFVAEAPSHFTPVLDKKDVGAGGEKTALNAEQKAAAEAMGLDEKQFAEFLAGQAKA